MATRNTGLNLCPDCDEYVEDCVCQDRDYEGGFADAAYDEQKEEEGVK